MKLKLWHIIIAVILILVLFDQCTEGKTITKTVTKERIVIDTFYKDRTVIKEIPKPVYINRTITKKGKDSIIYVDKPNDSTITARQFKTTLQSNKAKADLNIVSTGEVLDVTGTIQYPEKETITTIKKDRSGKFLYLKTDFTNLLESVELGTFIHFNNKIGVIAEVGFDRRLKTINNNGIKASVGVAIKF